MKWIYILLISTLFWHPLHMNSLQVLYFLYIGLLCHDTVVLQIALTHGIDTNYYNNRTEKLNLKQNAAPYYNRKYRLLQWLNDQ